MSSNYLTVNPSKNKFLLIGLNNRPFSFVVYCTSNLTNSLCNIISASSLTSLSLSPNRSPPSQALVTTIFAISVVSDTIDTTASIIDTTASTIDTTASTIATTLFHSHLGYCNSLCHSLPITHLELLQQIQNASSRHHLNIRTTFLHSRRFTDSRLNNAYNTK